MSKTIKGTGSDTLKTKNRTVNGVQFAITLEHGTANTAITNSMFDATKCNLKITLVGRGKPKTICSDNLKVLAADSAFLDAGWDVVMGTSNVELVPPAAGVFARRLLTYQVNFHGAINLRDRDELRSELVVNNGAYNAVLSPVNSQIEFAEIQCEETEMGLPIIESYALNTGDSTATVDPRDNVKQVTLINLDKSSTLEADTVIEQSALTTDQINITRQYLEMLTERTEQFTSLALASTRGQSFILAKGEDLDACGVELQLVTTNVNAGKNFIVARRLEITAASIIAGDARRELKSMKKMQRSGIPVNSERMAQLNQVKHNARKAQRN